MKYFPISKKAELVSKSVQQFPSKFLRNTLVCFKVMLIVSAILEGFS